MIQTSLVALLHARRQPGDEENDLLDPLCRLAGDVGNARVLVVAEHGLDLMCGLIRRGCIAATVLRPGDKPDGQNYNVLFVSDVAALASFDAVIRLARRSCGQGGRLIAGVSNARTAAGLARRLRLNGFSALHSTHLFGLTLLSADLRRPS